MEPKYKYFRWAIAVEEKGKIIGFLHSDVIKLQLNCIRHKTKDGEIYYRYKADRKLNTNKIFDDCMKNLEKKSKKKKLKVYGYPVSTTWSDEGV